MAARHDEVLARSLADPEGFWGELAAAIDWHRPYERVLDRTGAPFYRWFPGGEVSVCHNALDRHVGAGRGDQPALLWDSPVSGEQAVLSYRQLRDRVARFAGALRSLGVARGDRVVIYMPNVPEAVVGMLACARLGAVHSVVFGGFAPQELATRIDDARPRVVLAASCGLERSRVVPYKPLLDRALELCAAKPARCVILQRPQQPAELVAGRDVDWHELEAGAAPVDCVPVASTDPLYILYTSGTTGVPKGVVRDSAGYMVALQWSMRAIYGTEPGETFWAASDVGWVVGHSYIVYAPLLAGCTTVLYEGKPVGTPDAGAFWRVCRDHGVTTLFTAPTAFRAIKREDPHGELRRRYDLARLRALFLAGERADPDTVRWAEQLLGVPVVDHWWQTESGWPMASNCLGIERLPVKPGSAAKAVPGYDLRVLDETGHEVPPGRTGAIVCRLPLPPGCLPTLWQNDDGYLDTYLREYDGYYFTADAGFLDEDGYLWVMSRTDDIINTAGHRLSTGRIEEILAGHPDVAECAVIGVQDALKGQVPVGFVVLKAGTTHAEQEITTQLVQRVRDELGAVASFKQVCVVAALPKTRSGKVLRKTMRRIADGEDYRVPATIEDPAVLDGIRAALSQAASAS